MSPEDDLLQCGVNSVLMAAKDGTLVYGWEVRTRKNIFFAGTIDELIDVMVTSNSRIDPIGLCAALAYAEDIGLSEIIRDDEETIAC